METADYPVSRKMQEGEILLRVRGRMIREDLLCEKQGYTVIEAVWRKNG
jgi:hypothetical protein